MIEPTELEIKAFVGKGADYYLGVWFPADPLSLPVSGEFNGAACLGSFLWLAYRKLYFEGAIYLGVFGVMQAAMAMLMVLLMLAFPGFLSSAVTVNTVARAIPVVAFLMLAFFCGTYGNLCYQNYVYKHITEGREQGVFNLGETATLMRRGGVSVLSAIAAAVLLGCTQWLLILAFRFALSSIVPILAG